MNAVTEEVAKALGYYNLRYDERGRLVAMLPHFKCWIQVGEYPEQQSYVVKYNITLERLKQIRR